ncbi:MAG TPA: hypothetical protein VMA36_06485 [Candidatus Limnocylindria bacterium]|nr:hypothetical protein [Candidatus Limnocylindria bacterium]
MRPPPCGATITRRNALRSTIVPPPSSKTSARRAIAPCGGAEGMTTGTNRAVGPRRIAPRATAAGFGAAPVVEGRRVRSIRAPAITACSSHGETGPGEASTTRPAATRSAQVEGRSRSPRAKPGSAPRSTPSGSVTALRPGSVNEGSRYVRVAVRSAGVRYVNADVPQLRTSTNVPPGPARTVASIASAPGGTLATTRTPRRRARANAAVTAPRSGTSSGCGTTSVCAAGTSSSGAIRPQVCPASRHARSASVVRAASVPISPGVSGRVYAPPSHAIATSRTGSVRASSGPNEATSVPNARVGAYRALGRRSTS